MKKEEVKYLKDLASMFRSISEEHVKKSVGKDYHRGAASAYDSCFEFLDLFVKNAEKEYEIVD